MQGGWCGLVDFLEERLMEKEYIEVNGEQAAKIIEGSHEEYRLPAKLVQEYEMWKDRDPTLFLKRVAATVRAARRQLGSFVTLTGYSGWRQGSLTVKITSITTEGFTLEWYDHSDQLTVSIPHR